MRQRILTSILSVRPLEGTFRLLDIPLPLLTPRKPRLLDRTESFSLPISSSERLAELFDLHRLELRQMRIEGGAEVGVEGESEARSFQSNGLVGVGEDLGEKAKDGLEGDGLRSEEAGGRRGRVSSRSAGMESRMLTEPSP